MTVDNPKLREIVLRIIANRRGGDAVKAYKEGVAMGFDMAVLMEVVGLTRMDPARRRQFLEIHAAYLAAMEFP